MGWKYRFYLVVYKVLHLLQQSHAFEYSEIVRLEQELRQTLLPDKLEMTLFSLPYDRLGDDDHIVSLQRFASMLLRETGNTCPYPDRSLSD